LNIRKEIVMSIRETDARVAVVMLTFNRRDEVLRSLAHMTCLPEKPPIVVVDNGSTDGTATAVRDAYPQVEVVDAGGNLGAAGRTLGVRHLDTPYVALADDDTWWEPGSLARAADVFDACPRLAIATARVLVGVEQREDPTCAAMANSPLPRVDGMPGPPILGFLAGASVVRREAFLGAGGFEPRLFLRGEEQLLAADLAAAGWWLCYVPALTVHHMPCVHRDGVARHWHLVRNALWFSWMRRPLPTALRGTLRTAWSAPWDRVAMRGLTTALAGLPWALQRRRVLPGHVERGLRMLEPR
jgi:GT2 family glycosyltransferase